VVVCYESVDKRLAPASYIFCTSTVMTHTRGIRQATAFGSRDGQGVLIYGPTCIDILIPVNRLHPLIFSVAIKKGSDNLPKINKEPTRVPPRPLQHRPVDT
jgi:hypothetical protein